MDDVSSDEPTRTIRLAPKVVREAAMDRFVETTEYVDPTGKVYDPPELPDDPDPDD